MINPLAGAAKLLIRGYQRWISPALGPRCRYYPSCSQYALEAVGRHGFWKGTLLGTWRVLRCNPWSKGGVDHIPEQGKWRAPEWVPPDDWAGYDLIERRRREAAGGEQSERE